MSSAILGQELGKRLIDLMGLPDKVVAIDIRLRVDEPAVITVERIIGADEAEGLMTEMRRYELVEKDGSDGL